jgi:hypothetical protein
VIDAVGPDRVADLDAITGAILRRLDPSGRMRANPMAQEPANDA